MVVEVLLLVAGLGLLLGGGDLMVRGACALARGLGISPLVIGLTVVAFGTSAPELVVNVLAAARGTTEISFGNIVGSNMANVGLILGCSALARPLVVHIDLIRREIPIMIGAALAALLLAADPFLGPGAAGRYGRLDGGILLALFAAFLVYTALKVVRDRDAAAAIVAERAPGGDGPRGCAPRGYAPPQGRGILAAGAMTLAGMAALLYGGHLTVESAVDLARGLGVPEFLVGLTVVAVGTSLPELATGVTASLRNKPDIAVGNVVGSNLFNILFVLGLTATIRPIRVPKGGMTDLVVMTALAAILIPIAWTTSRRRITRSEGLVLLATYLAYVAWRSLAEL